jgi:hypothetical protein
VPSLGLRFLDSEAVVECDSDRLWEALAYLYRPALVPVSAAAPLRLQVSAAAGVRAISCGSTRQLAAPGAGETLAEELIFTEIVTRVSTHWLLHAAALAGPHGGVLIVGESGAGQTTLALALSRQGYQWLSDEVAAIDRTTGLLESFPRGVLIRPQTLCLLPELRERSQPWSLAGEETRFCWQPEIAHLKVPIRHVFILPTSAQTEPSRVAVSHLTPALTRRLATDPELAGARVAASEGFVTLSWERVLSPGPLRRWAQACQQENVLLLGTDTAPTARPSFEAPPRAEAIAPSAAWLSLAAAALNRPGGNTPQGGLFPFLKELGAVLQDTVPISLRPGPLAATVALVDSLCRGRGTTLPSEY